jgi:hypothetical protein
MAGLTVCSLKAAPGLPYAAATSSPTGMPGFQVCAYAALHKAMPTPSDLVCTHACQDQPGEVHYYGLIEHGHNVCQDTLLPWHVGSRILYDNL